MINDQFEKEYSQTVTELHRKKFAQFFTPLPLVELMSRWILGNSYLKSVLEPAFGLGIFSRFLLENNQNLKIKAFEVDELIFNKAKKIINKNNNFNLLLEDYMYNDWNNKYDGIICNPPYLKFHDYNNKNVLKEVTQKLSISLNGFSNLYVLFLLKSINQIKTNGRIAYIIPSEFLNSDYGKLVKKYLIENGNLRYVIIIDFKENVFEKATTTASILLFSNDSKSNNVTFYNVKNLNDLESIKQNIIQYPNIKLKENTFELKKLDYKTKWRAYYQKQNSIRFKYLVPFSNYGKVMRGIATGDNNYFTFNLSKANKLGIDEKYLLPCICKSTNIKTEFFTKKDFENLKNNDKNTFLINANGNEKNKNIQSYITYGEENGVNKKYLTSKRKPWYSIENRKPAPILVSVFNRNGLKFIKNEAKLINLTTFHCIYLNMFSSQKEDLLFAYLLTNIAKEIFNDNSREYGNGLKKFEPNDINKALMLDLDKLSKDDEEKILKLYFKYKESILNDEKNDKLLKEINQIFLDKYSI
jgi:adenine-specific DNA-methyltransferase